MLIRIWSAWVLPSDLKSGAATVFWMNSMESAIPVVVATLKQAVLVWFLVETSK